MIGHQKRRSIPALILWAAVASSATGAIPEVSQSAGSASTGIFSPVAVNSSFTSRDASGVEHLDLLVLWRGTPGWFLASGGGSSSGSESEGKSRATFRYSGLEFTVELDRAQRRATLLGQTLDVSVNNVVLVDDVDSPRGARIAAHTRVDPIMAGPAGHLGLILKTSPEIMDFLRCNALPAGGRGKAFLEPLCLQNIGANTWGQDLVIFATPDKDNILGHLYGAGERAVILVAHGGYSTMESWEPQARALVESGFRVLAFDTRPAVALKRTGKETECLYDPVCMSVDVLAAVRYLRSTGATSISVVGGSAGGGAVAQASADAKPGEIDRIVLLAPMGIKTPEKMKGNKLFVVARDDANAAGPRLPGIRKQYDAATEPKSLILLEGSAHGQRIFVTPDGEPVMKAILRFLARQVPR